MKEYLSESEEQTLKVGYEFAKELKGGDIVALTGDLGVGKTVFAKGICKYFNVKEYVTSPTYTIVNEYHGDILIYHFDLYRLENEDDLYNIGFSDYLTNDAVLIIEWADIIPEIFRNLKIISVNIKRSGLSEDRRIEIKC